MARAGEGGRTKQYNPGAYSLAQYAEAVTHHTRREHDAGGKVIHETPKKKRQEFAEEIWRRRQKRGVGAHGKT